MRKRCTNLHTWDKWYSSEGRVSSPPRCTDPQARLSSDERRLCPGVAHCAPGCGPIRKTYRKCPWGCASRWRFHPPWSPARHPGRRGRASSDPKELRTPGKWPWTEPTTAMSHNDLFLQHKWPHTQDDARKHFWGSWIWCTFRLL